MSKGEYYEYSSAADITLPNVPIKQWMVKNEFTATAEEVLDLSEAIQTVRGGDRRRAYLI